MVGEDPSSREARQDASTLLRCRFAGGHRRSLKAAVVELSGIEPLTSSLRTRRSPN